MLNTKKKKIASVTSEISMFPVQRIMKHEQKIFSSASKNSNRKENKKTVTAQAFVSWTKK